MPNLREVHLGSGGEFTCRLPALMVQMFAMEEVP